MRFQGFAAAWADKAAEAASTGQRHIFDLKGDALLQLAKQDPALRQHLEEISSADKPSLENTVTDSGAPGCLPALFTRLFEQSSSSSGLRLNRYNQVKERDGSGVLYHELMFQNWGRTVKNTPAVTLFSNTAFDEIFEQVC